MQRYGRVRRSSVAIGRPRQVSDTKAAAAAARVPLVMSARSPTGAEGPQTSTQAQQADHIRDVNQRGDMLLRLWVVRCSRRLRSARDGGLTSQRGQAIVGGVLLLNVIISLAVLCYVRRLRRLQREHQQRNGDIEARREMRELRRGSEMARDGTDGLEATAEEATTPCGDAEHPPVNGVSKGHKRPDPAAFDAAVSPRASTATLPPYTAHVDHHGAHGRHGQRRSHLVAIAPAHAHESAIDLQAPNAAAVDTNLV
nr:hypothetical protein HK105_004546 [Polyrhizophydium stewartii]